MGTTLRDLLEVLIRIVRPEVIPFTFCHVLNHRHFLGILFQLALTFLFLCACDFHVYSPCHYYSTKHTGGWNSNRSAGDDSPNFLGKFEESAGLLLPRFFTQVRSLTAWVTSEYSRVRVRWPGLHSFFPISYYLCLHFVR